MPTHCCSIRLTRRDRSPSATSNSGGRRRPGTHKTRASIGSAAISRCRSCVLARLVISCGWSGIGFGVRRECRREELLILTHGAAHHATLILVERYAPRPRLIAQRFSFCDGIFGDGCSTGNGSNGMPHAWNTYVASGTLSGNTTTPPAAEDES